MKIKFFAFLVLLATIFTSVGTVHAEEICPATPGALDMLRISAVTGFDIRVKSMETFNAEKTTGVFHRLYGCDDTGTYIRRDFLVTHYSHGESGKFLASMSNSDGKIYFSLLELELPRELWDGLDDMVEQDILADIMGQPSFDEALDLTGWELAMEIWPLTQDQFDTLSEFIPIYDNEN